MLVERTLLVAIALRARLTIGLRPISKKVDRLPDARRHQTHNRVFLRELVRGRGGEFDGFGGWGGKEAFPGDHPVQLRCPPLHRGEFGFGHSECRSLWDSVGRLLRGGGRGL